MVTRGGASQGPARQEGTRSSVGPREGLRRASKPETLRSAASGGFDSHAHSHDRSGHTTPGSERSGRAFRRQVADLAGRKASTPVGPLSPIVGDRNPAQSPCIPATGRSLKSVGRPWQMCHTDQASAASTLSPSGSRVSLSSTLRRQWAGRSSRLGQSLGLRTEVLDKPLQPLPRLDHQTVVAVRPLVLVEAARHERFDLAAYHGELD